MEIVKKIIEHIFVMHINMFRPVNGLFNIEYSHDAYV